MKILVLGTSGFVGSWVTKTLIDAGYQVSCAVRNTKLVQRQFPEATIIHCNFLQDHTPESWLPRLEGIDVIINCVGIFYHPDKKIIWDIHYTTPKALFAAAEKTNIKKIIQLSALGIDGYKTEYAQSKLAAENFLRTLALQTIILRPSFIYGRGSQGGISLLYSLAALPLIPLPGEGNQTLQPIHIDDLAKAIQHLVELSSPESLTLTAVSSQPITIKSMLLVLRKWLGYPTAPVVSIPMKLIKFLALFGNLSLHSKINTAALQMLEKNNVATPEETEQFQQITSTKPRIFREGINKIPSTEQDRWYAKLSLLKPLLRISLAFMWLISAMLAFFYSHTNSYKLLAIVGISPFLQPIILYGAATINALIGIILLINYKIRINCFIQLTIMLVYTLIITFKLPQLWLDPFGPIVKNIPILISILLLYSLEKD